MPLGANLHRRRAIYYWRRRLPGGWALASGAKCLKLSLRTSQPARARFLAAQLDALAARLFMSARPDIITKEQLSRLFQAALVAHGAKLDHVAAFARQEPGFDPQDEMATERAMGWSYRIASRKGSSARVDEEDKAAMVELGLAEAEIERVAGCLNEMGRWGALRPSQCRLRELVEAVGAASTPGNMAQAEPIYLRALGEALLRTKERYAAEGLPYDMLVAAAFAPSEKTARSLAAEPEPAEIVKVAVEARNHEPPTGAIVEANSAGVRMDEIGGRLINEKRQDGEWDDKTCRQAAFIFGLFGRFLEEEHGVTDLARLAQPHCDAFDAFLRALFKSVGKSPKDKDRSIGELRRMSEARSPAERGLEPGTRNRDLTFLAQALARARKSGVPIDSSVSLTEFRARKKKRGRDQRAIPPAAAMTAFFSLPVFAGCRDWTDLHAPGPALFHRAAYWGPMLAHYAGMRREEFCALAVDDVVTSNGDHPYIHVCFNAFGRVKNVQSVRNLALHPELIRLGFLDYVETPRAFGHSRVFPDLYSPSSRGLLGDRLYDELQPAFRTAGLTTHQVRHFFGNALKQGRVPEEFRADLLGHGGKSETTERYCDPIGIALQLEELRKLPVLTRHLSPAPIRLLPWVERNEIAPWSYARRRVGRGDRGSTP